MQSFGIFLGSLFFLSTAAFAEFPRSFDLRSVVGHSYVTSVKSQQGGTCWTHGTMAAVESNLLMTGAWQTNSETGEPNLAEYHLDWWNGFNSKFNPDAPDSGGLTVHQGGDYRIAAAYFSRGAGAVRDIDGQSYSSPPLERDSKFHFYYVRDIEWFSVNQNLDNIDRVKKAIMDGGVIGTALAWSSDFYSDDDHTFYQPPSSTYEPNHAVSIVGWDDDKATAAEHPGAWLTKNSWGASWGENGFFWLSYYDKTATKHPEMGAVSFRNAEKLAYSTIYYHDLHGWRDTKANISEAFNAFVARSNIAQELIKSVSFYATTDNVPFTVKIFGQFENGQLQNELSAKSGTIMTKGFHTIDLDNPISLAPGSHFYVYLKLAAGGHPFDKTSYVPVLLGASEKPLVESRANPGESFYWNGTKWQDLTNDDKTANFCIKALAVTK